MPIKFRCSHCQQFLGISRAKAGLVTDCPTCGRTIRVPELDGSVKPLPKAELDLKDSELSDALAALARIGDAPAKAGGEATERSPASASPAAVAVAPRRETVPVPLPEPVSLAPSIPIAAEPVEMQSAGPSVRRSEEALAELASLPSERRRATTHKPEAGRDGPAKWIAAFATGFLMFGAGFFVGRGTATSETPSVSTEPTSTAGETAETRPGADASPAASPLPAEPSGSLTPALTGRITFVNSDGATGPDEGARVIVLPEQREGSAKLAVVGFRAGASSADQQLSRTSLRALGGDYTIADAEGRYTIQLPNAGTYHVLIMSRHQPRDDAGFLDPNVQRILSEYFDRPASLIGPVAYHLGPFRFQGDSASPRDHLFER